MALIYKTFCVARTVFCALFFGLFIGLGTGAGNAHAQTPPATDLYTVEGVQVDVTADSALAARDQAFDKAQVDAFTVLAGRMLPESELAAFKAPDAATISTMVQDYEVTAEKLSSVRYIGTYTFSFRGSAVERYFNVQGKSYTNVVSAPMLILPFYQKDGRTYLWSPYNVWIKAWNRAGQGAIVPIGDLEDVNDIGDEDVFSYDPDKLTNMLKRYAAGDAAIILATPDGSLARASEDDIVSGQSLTISLYRTDRGQPEQVRDIAIIAQNGEPYAKLLERAVAESQNALKQNWKERTAIAAPANPGMPLNNRLLARVRNNSLEGWARIQSTLNRVNLITDTSLNSLSPREALVEISFRGDEQTLRNALAQAGMTLSHPQYAGYSEAPDPTQSRIIYDLSFGAPAQPTPVYQAPQQPQRQPARQPLGGGYQSPRQQPYPSQNGGGYSGQF